MKVKLILPENNPEYESIKLLAAVDYLHDLCSWPVRIF